MGTQKKIEKDFKVDLTKVTFFITARNYNSHLIQLSTSTESVRGLISVNDLDYLSEMCKRIADEIRKDSDFTN